MTGEKMDVGRVGRSEKDYDEGDALERGNKLKLWYLIDEAN